VNSPPAGKHPDIPANLNRKFYAIDGIGLLDLVGEAGRQVHRAERAVDHVMDTGEKAVFHDAKLVAGCRSFFHVTSDADKWKSPLKSAAGQGHRCDWRFRKRSTRHSHGVRNTVWCNFCRSDFNTIGSDKMSFTRAHAISVVPFTLSVLFCSTSMASVCEDPGTMSYVSAAVVDHDISVLERGLGVTEQKNQDLQILARGAANLSFGFSHRYSKFDFAGIEPQTNAHLHTSAFALHWRRGDRHGNVRAAVAPTLSASSNVLGHPQKYRGDTLQLSLALVRQQRLSESVVASYGVCGDDRFGRYRFYPTAVLEWRPHPDWEIDLGFPVSGVTYRISDSLSSGLRAAPDGSEWHVMNRDFDAESRFVYESYAVDWLFEFEAGNHLSLVAGIGRQLRNNFEMTLQSGERLSVDSRPVDRISAEIRWRF
jgi:hypothetical protein